jgi:branched-chain amino acid transport system permease protein
MATPAPTIIVAPASARGRLPDGRWTPLEIAFWLIPVACFFLLPNYRVLGSQVLITALFAVSLDLILGYAGIVSLGHAAFFGIGAYTAGLLAVHGWHEPLSGLAAAAIVAAVAGYAVSFLVVRGGDLTRLMVTLGIGLMLWEAANKAHSVTGGVDGLSGVTIAPILGLFRFDIGGRTAYVYALVVVFAVFLWSGASSITVRSAARHPRRRQVTPAIAPAPDARGRSSRSRRSSPVKAHSRRRRSSSATTRWLPRSAADDHAGAGRHRPRTAAHRRGDFHDRAGLPVGIDPVYWQFWIGFFLIVIVCSRTAASSAGSTRCARGCGQSDERRQAAPSRELLPLRGQRSGESRKRGGPLLSTALRTQGLSKRWGAFDANSDISLEFVPGARHALIGPNGAGKTTFINLLTGVFPPTAGDVFLGNDNITGLSQHERVAKA